MAGVEFFFFVILSLIILGGKEELLPAKGLGQSLTTSYKAKGEEFRPDLSAKFTKEHGRGWSGIWHPQEWNLVTENTRALERRNSVTGMNVDLNCVSSISVLLIRTAPPLLCHS